MIIPSNDKNGHFLYNKRALTMYKAEVKGEYSTAVSILDERHVYSSVR